MEAIIGIGVPGCGKTTVLKPLANKLGYAYINGDDIRRELTGDAKDHSRESDVWATAYERIKTALTTSGVIIDATHSKVVDRKKMAEFCREHGASTVTAYWFDIDLETCMARNKNRTRKVPEEALRKMYQRLLLNPPATTDGFDSVVVLRTDDTDPEDV